MHQQPETASEEFYPIGTIDVWNLHSVRWPVLRAFCRKYVEQLELRQYERELLATRRWRAVRCVPHPDGSAHIFNVYGLTAPGE